MIVDSRVSASINWGSIFWVSLQYEPSYFGVYVRAPDLLKLPGRFRVDPEPYGDDIYRLLGCSYGWTPTPGIKLNPMMFSHRNNGHLTSVYSAILMYVAGLSQFEPFVPGCKTGEDRHLVASAVASSGLPESGLVY